MTGKLTDAKVLVIGTGGLGGPAALTLASAGVGRIVLVDDDVVETSNLPRQPLFGEADIGQRKAVVAARRLGSVFPSVKVEGLEGRFDESSALALTGEADVVVDCSDDFETKFLANDVALTVGRMLVHGGVLRYTIQLLTIGSGETGCLRCLFEAPPPPGSVPTGAEAGILGPLAGMAGALMGAEALRLLAGERGVYAGRLVTYEARAARARSVAVRRREDCPSCLSALSRMAALRAGVGEPPRERG